MVTSFRFADNRGSVVGQQSFFAASENGAHAHGFLWRAGAQQGGEMLPDHAAEELAYLLPGRGMDDGYSAESKLTLAGGSGADGVVLRRFEDNDDLALSDTLLDRPVRLACLSQRGQLVVAAPVGERVHAWPVLGLY